MTRFHWLTLAAPLALLTAGGCPNVPGVAGMNGADGSNGADGANGVNCWDLNGNGVGDPGEDANGDGLFDALDCRGAQGPADTSAMQRLFGTGVSGEKRIAADTRFAMDDGEGQWTDFIVEPGVTLRLQTGAALHCTGQFINRGTIIVEDGAQGADRTGFDASTLVGSFRPAALGINTLAAGSGEVGDATAQRSGGQGGDGLSEFEGRALTLVGLKAGSGGGAAFEKGGNGGGSTVVFAAKGVMNEGTIIVDGGDGAPGGGGGGGGVIVFASPLSITNSATGVITARGGAGGAATDASAPGGGGGGGIIRFVAPEVNNLGSTDVSGGAAGADGAAGSVTAALRSGGGGGGGSAGAGGAAGGVMPSGDPGTATSGSAGFTLTNLIDPMLKF